ncbi:MAG: hypothetical protein H6834_11860 [Planctomycetes bacterium]|nr:hypothetical protein [Planctomycetota bacterium]
MGDDVRWVEGLIYIIAVVGGLLLPVFKQIREKRTGKPVVIHGEEGEPDAGPEDSGAPMYEDREPADVPEPTVGKVPERQVGQFEEAKGFELSKHHMAEGLSEPRRAEPVAEIKRPVPIQPEPASFSQFQGFAGVERGKKKARKPPQGTMAPAARPRVGTPLRNAGDLRRAVVMKEILDRPLGLRDGVEGKPPGWL